MSHSPEHRCWAEISCEALRHNAHVARTRAGADAQLLAVIKANGYGHGLTAVARALADDAQLFGVANLQEAREAREAVPHPIMILGPALAAERAEIVQRGFIASVSSSEEAADFSHASKHLPAALNCVVDTGMGRMGIRESAALEHIGRIARLPAVQIHSISSHLPVADEDSEYTRNQLQRFAAVVNQVRTAIPGNYLVHTLPTAGVFGFSGSAFDLVRAGLMLYGVTSLPEFQSALVPAMTWKTRVALLRDLPAGSSVSYGRTFITKRPTRVATLSAGYADGVRRGMSNRGAVVLIRGERCPIIGRITMDLTMVDVTDLADVATGDEVVIIGRQGDKQILATEFAERASTIAWEVFTGIGSRVARVYV